MSPDPIEAATKAAQNAERRMFGYAQSIADDVVAGMTPRAWLVHEYKLADAASKAAHARLDEVLREVAR